MRRALSYANVMATLALFVALGGTGYAAMTITSKDVRDNSLKSADVKNGSLKSADVKNGSLQAVDVAPGQVPAGWSYRGDVRAGAAAAAMPAIPGLGTASAACTTAGAAQLSVKNTSAGAGFTYVATLTTAAGSTASDSGIFPGATGTITLPPSAQAVWQISPTPAGTPGPVVTIVASNQVTSPGPTAVCSVSATAFFQDPAG